MLVRISLLGQLNVDLEVLPKLLDHSAASANDLRVVLGVDLQLDLVTPGSLVLFLLLELGDLLEESALGLLYVVGRPRDDNRVGLLLRARDLKIKRRTIKAQAAEKRYSIRK